MFEDTLEEQPDNKPPIPRSLGFFDQLENIADIYRWSDRLTLETALASLKANAHAWAMELDRSEKMDYKKV